MSHTTEDQRAYIVLYGTTADAVKSALSEQQIGSINAYVANALMEYGVDVDAALVSGNRADVLSEFDREGRDA